MSSSAAAPRRPRCSSCAHQCEVAHLRGVDAHPRVVDAHLAQSLRPHQGHQHTTARMRISIKVSSICHATCKPRQAMRWLCFARHRHLRATRGMLTYFSCIMGADAVVRVQHRHGCWYVRGASGALAGRGSALRTSRARVRGPVNCLVNQC